MVDSPVFKRLSGHVIRLVAYDEVMNIVREECLE